ncbi:hypothetical protein [Streptomyces sp. NPDC058620]|uniref:hypothetical protein n=1 Tax=Streptomyces sp. NPDC058620 TaxID=3346560 RepID=UPI00365E5234
MDNGWAAVVAGAAGAGGAAVAAWATGRAMVNQARVQARDRHEHWLREQRQEAYGAMLAAADAVHDALEEVMRGRTASASAEELRPAYLAVNAALRVNQRATRAVLVLGPDSVGRLCMPVRHALERVVLVWREPDMPFDQLAIDHAAAMDEFRDAFARFWITGSEVIQESRPQAN